MRGVANIIGWLRRVRIDEYEIDAAGVGLVKLVHPIVVGVRNRTLGRDKHDHRDVALERRVVDRPAIQVAKAEVGDGRAYFEILSEGNLRRNRGDSYER